MWYIIVHIPFDEIFLSTTTSDATKNHYSFSETSFVPIAYRKYLIADILRSERVLDTDELWYGVGVPSLAGKQD